MPQNTNLNVAPYYDDFDVNKNYHRVLFKPGNSVQARELTTLQTILQNQIEKFGQHFFKDGAMVIPGNVGYDLNYTCVEINSIHLGIPVTEYLYQLVGKTIKGEISNVLAKIENVLVESDSERKNNTLYIKYLSSNQSNVSNSTFLDGENLILQENVDYSLGVLNQNDSFATTISINSTSVGSAAKISSGVYFTRGFFVNVGDQTVILDQYSNTPSYRVGLFIKESFAVASNEYSDLLDNSQGYYNFAAPGADRLIIEAELIKKPLNEYNDQNFIQLLKIEDGILESIITSTEYDKILDELARRTYDESGDYYIKPFQLEVKESLNNYIGNNGIYSEGQVTKNGSTPSDSLACISISPGKAYIRGYEVEKISNTIIDYSKSRDTNNSINENIQFNFGTQFELNNVYGYIPIGISSDSYVKLFNRRTDTVGISTGKLIGVARLYDLKLKSSEYRDSSSTFDASLYDIQTYTTLNISNGFSQEQAKSSYIEGKNSGANGYLVIGITTETTQFDLYQVSGNFIKNEALIVNGVETNRIITNVTDYSINDIRQVTSYNTEPAIFTADAVLSRKINLANNGASFTISAADAGTISTIRTSNDNFYLNVRPGDVISYAKPGEILPTYNVIKDVGVTSSIVTIKPLESVVNVNSGELPISDLTITDLKKVTLKVKNSNTKLYSKLNNDVVSKLDLTGSSIYLRETIGPISIGNSSAFEVSVFEGSSSSILVPFDEEAYTLVYSDGTVENLTAQKLIPNLDSSNNSAQGRITLRNLSSSSTSGNSYLTVTYQKLNCKTRKKSYNRCSTLTIDKTKVGINSVGNGLTYSSVYGCRVEDDIISLNVPEVSNVIGIFESSNENDPILPFLTVTSGNISNIIIGEKIIGETSNAVATIVSTDSSTKIYFCYLNQKSFNLTETIRFEESGITANIGSLIIGDKNIINSYILDDGSRESYLDFSRIIKKAGAEYPTKKITIVYNYYDIGSNDTGNFVGVNSYDLYRYNDIPTRNGVRLSDIIDFRPRVLPYDGNSLISPFDFESRKFNPNTSSSNSIVMKDSALVLSYEYYLPRIDKIFLDKDGNFNLVKGISSISPKAPNSLNYSLEVATLYAPAYVFNVNDVKVVTTSHERYTMKDISNIDERLSKVEHYTSLSLLEANTQSLSIIDPDTNLNRFKSGFFVDDFSSSYLGDTKNTLYRASIDLDDKILRPQPYSTYIDLEFDELTSANVKKSGSIVTLDYSNLVYLSNQYATRFEAINPFNVLDWNGSINLNPSSDSWIESETSNSNKKWGEWDNWANGKVNINQTDQDALNETSNLYVRSRNIGISAKGLLPKASFNGFFDNVKVNDYIIPKLVEIEMISGSFTVGETVEGTFGNSSIIFKVAKLNHKSGPYDSPTQIYSNNPYSATDSTLSSNYSVTSTLINVDIDSLNLNTESNFYGRLEINMVLRGNTSGAIATVKRIRIIADENGSFLGSLFIPDSKINSNPKFKIGTKAFVLSTSENNSPVDTTSDSFAESIFVSNGTIQSIERNDVNLKNIKITSDITNSNSSNLDFKNSLAQSFFVRESSGIFITFCDVYFVSKDSNNIPVTLQIRTMKNGRPSQEILPFSEVVLQPSDVYTFTIGVPTRFTFDSPVYLEGNGEYCIVLSTSSSDYKVWISRLGEQIKTSGVSIDSDSVASQIPGIGSLFKSQNTAGIAVSPYESLKFDLFRAEFKYSTGTLNFYNPTQTNSYNINQISRLNPESIQAFSRSLSVNLNVDLTTEQVNTLTSGYVLTQTSNSSFKSKVTSVVGKLAIDTNLNIINSGYGYSNAPTSYNNVKLISLTGIGTAAKATIGVESGIVTYATITEQGSNYSYGDILTIDYKDINNLGEGAVFSVSNTGNVTSFNTIILDEVQGELNVSSGDLILNDIPLAGVYPAEAPKVINDGVYLKINSKNHGMYSQNNIVKISGVESDVPPTRLVSDITGTSNTLSVEDALNFVNFEGGQVGSGNTGYLIINNEIIGYTGVDTTVSPNIITLNTIPSYSRGVDNTTPTYHFINDLIFKYEFNGISLRKINNQHSLSDVDYTLYDINLDSYYIKILDNNGKYFTRTKSGGSYNSILNSGVWNSPRVTRNIAYSTLRPIVNVLTPGSTRLNSRIRTYTSTSVDGNEVSFIDNGFEDFSLSSDNNFNSMRGIFSKENELEYIETSNNKSITLQLNFSTNNSKISPIIDLERVGIIPIMNRINNPIHNYSSDSRINKLLDDPNTAIYVSKRINLTKPADSLKVIFDAYRHQSNDIRVAYRIFRDDVEDEYQLYELFPGYGNIDSKGNTIDPFKNSGLSDVLVTPSGNLNEFKTYEYNMRTNLSFTGFQIKIIMAGVDQSNVPKIKDLRVISTL